MLSFSILICTHNPEEQVLKKLLNAINKFYNHSPEHEVILIDNNSTKPIESLEFVKLFFSQKRKVKIVVEKNKGLTAARLAGVKNAQYNWIIFFDDDNEPAPNYLIEAEKIIQNYPTLGCLGPGNINVNFIEDKISLWLSNNKEIFQERKMNEIVIDNVKWDQNDYPNGTGMVVKKDILNIYSKMVVENKITLTDRNGKSLMSGGDTQILLLAIKLGFYAGSAPSLELIHNISKYKTNFRKILQLQFMLNASAIKAYNEIFTDEPFKIKEVTNLEVIKLLYYEFKKILRQKNIKDFLIIIFTKTGQQYANHVAGNMPSPVILRFLKKLINA